MTIDPHNPPAAESVVGGIFDIGDDLQAMAAHVGRVLTKIERLLADVRADGLHVVATVAGVTAVITITVGGD